MQDGVPTEMDIEMEEARAMMEEALQISRDNEDDYYSWCLGEGLDFQPVPLSSTPGSMGSPLNGVSTSPVVEIVPAERPEMTILSEGIVPPLAEVGHAPRTWRKKGQRLEVTVPRCALEPGELLERIVKAPLLVQKLRQVVVVRHLHEDDCPHLHAFIWTTQAVSFDSSWLDEVCGMHGHYDIVASPVRYVRYMLSKKQGEAVWFGINPETQEVARSGKRARVESEIIRRVRQNSETFQDLVRDDDEDIQTFLLMHPDKAIRYANLCASIRRSAEVEWQHPELRRGEVDEAVSEEILGWLAGNIGVNRKHKQAQLWIVGPPNSGKTTLVLYLRQFMKVLLVTNYEVFYDTYTEEHDLVYMDEVDPENKKPAPWMNQFAAGEPMVLAVKGHQVSRSVNKPLIVLSNYRIEQVYTRNPAPVLARFKQVVLRERLAFNYHGFTED